MRRFKEYKDNMADLRTHSIFLSRIDSRMKTFMADLPPKTREWPVTARWTSELEIDVPGKSSPLYSVVLSNQLLVMHSVVRSKDYLEK
jgi:hypothetical protein